MPRKRWYWLPKLSQLPDPIPQEERVYLDVPYGDKERAKEAGKAMWDAEKKQWYCHQDDVFAFEPWWPK